MEEADGCGRDGRNQKEGHHAAVYVPGGDMRRCDATQIEG